MKIIIPILFLFAQISSVYSQDLSDIDNAIHQYFIGTWTHIRSIMPNGDIIEYDQEFTFNEDGTGVCYRFTDGIPETIIVKWEIKGGQVFLYSTRDDGQIMISDVISIEYLDETRFFADKIFGPEEFRKSCFYKRKEMPAV